MIFGLEELLEEFFSEIATDIDFIDVESAEEFSDIEGRLFEFGGRRLKKIELSEVDNIKNSYLKAVLQSLLGAAKVLLDKAELGQFKSLLKSAYPVFKNGSKVAVEAELAGLKRFLQIFSVRYNENIKSQQSRVYVSAADNSTSFILAAIFFILVVYPRYMANTIEYPPLTREEEAYINELKKAEARKRKSTYPSPS